ncbi:MAG: MFS transporter [Bacteroidales bacterium]
MKLLLTQSTWARWTALIIVSITMFCGSFFSDVMSPLKPMLEAEFNWTSNEYGLFTSAYGWLNVFFLMLIFGGIILDKMGIRFTGLGGAMIMLIGASIKFLAITHSFDEGATIFGIRSQVAFASAGFALFGVGIEISGLTITKVIVKWFKGRELALALGLQVGVSRIGTMLAIATAAPLAKHFGFIGAPLLFCIALLCIGLVAYLVYMIMDKQFDNEQLSQQKSSTQIHEDEFHLLDIKQILINRGFWLITLLCVLFYSSVWPFLKYATDLMVNKFHVSTELAGNIPAILLLLALVFSPIFGHLYDKKGKGVSIMITGGILLTFAHLSLALPFLHQWQVAIMLMIVLGIAFSLLAATMWPSVPKIIPDKQLGTAYSLIFYVQNIGLTGVPYLIGWLLNKYCITGTKLIDGKVINQYDYTLPMLVFASFGALSLLVACWLKRIDKKYTYGLEVPNIKNELP